MTTEIVTPGSCGTEMHACTPELERVASLEQEIKEVHQYLTGSKWQQAKYLLKRPFQKHYFTNPPAWRVFLRMGSAKRRVVPSFTATGAIRSGTTTLSNYIMQHPYIVMPLSKELETSSPVSNYIKAQFPTKKEMDKVREKYGMAVTGDCTPLAPSISSIYHAKALNPDLKISVILRNPVDRTLSHVRWSQQMMHYFYKDPLWKCLPDAEEILRREMADFNRGSGGFMTYCGGNLTGYIQHSSYLPFLRVLFDVFDRNNIHIISADEFYADSEAVVNKFFNFIGLPSCKLIAIKEKNSLPKLEVSAELRAEMTSFFKPHNQELYGFLDRDFGWG